jgi:hypothetical protein
MSRSRFWKAIPPLVLIKILHTAVWVFFNVVLFYLLYAVATDRIDKWVWIGIGLIFLEGAVLLVFKSICPITLLARQYTDSTRDNFDIYLPNWLARHNKLIYTTFFVFILVALLYRLTTG